MTCFEQLIKSSCQIDGFIVPVVDGVAIVNSIEFVVDSVGVAIDVEYSGCPLTVAAEKKVDQNCVIFALNSLEFNCPKRQK